MQTPRLKISSTALHRELCKRSFYYFVQYFWDTVIAEDPVWNWHIKYMCDDLQKIVTRLAKLPRDADGNPILDKKKRKGVKPTRLPKEMDYYIYNIPPGSSKSTIVSQMLVIWAWGIDPSLRSICGSYASTPAEDIAEKCYNIFQSDKHKRLFPELHTRRANGGKTHFKNGKKGERYTTSTGSAITGVHGHLLLIDDPMNPKIAYSKTERDTANKWVSETLSSRKVSKDYTVTIVVMQRLHQADTTGYLLKKQEEGLKVQHVCLPAELSNDVKPVELKYHYKEGLFDPIRSSRENLQVSRIELGSYGYAGQMQQRPSPEGGGIIKKEWFRTVARTKVPDHVIPHFQLDTAYTEQEKNDPSACLGYYMEGNDIYLFCRSSVWMEFPALVKWIPSYTKSNGYTGQSKIHVEPKASGKSVVQTVSTLTNLNIVESEPPTDDKLTLAHVVSPKIEVGRVILHAGPWADALIDQVCSFPNAEHDDEFDCLIAIIRRELSPTSEDQDLNQLTSFFNL